MENWENNPYQSPSVETTTFEGSSVPQAFSNSQDPDLRTAEWLSVRRFRLLVLVYGKRMYGVVDHVPSVLYVATFFFHLYWIPVIPLGSWIYLVDKHGCRSANPVFLGLSIKSLIFAWVRLLLILGLAFSIPCALGGLITMLNHGFWHPMPFYLTGLMIGAALTLFAMRHMERASPDRARALAIRAGFPEDMARELVERSKENEFASEDAVMPCPRCGRVLSVHSQICPTCDWRKNTPD